ncbi:hypothetical protein CIB48_g11503 [Xylaria polymorpha]|nr:hypothetical protein CIB48_g11503 [Xylaria polymorpha]
MALYDAVFDNMTYDQWETTIRSKVASSWNLHSQLPRDLDFFILLSSLSGIYGSLAQSNYAAGCTFQDAPAHHRNALGFGKTSVSLDLGWVKDVGIIAEREDYRQNRGHARDMKQINAAEVLALLDVYCNPESGEAQGEGDWMGKSQLLVGAVTPLDTYRWGQAPTMFETNPLLTGFRVAADLERRSSDVPQRQQAVGGNTSLLFRQAADTSAQAKVVETALKGKLARALGIAIEEVDDRRRLSNYGVDSLMALELRNWIQHDFHASVAVFEIMNSDMSIVELGRLVVKRAEDIVE